MNNLKLLTIDCGNASHHVSHTFKLGTKSFLSLTDTGNQSPQDDGILL